MMTKHVKIQLYTENVLSIFTCATIGLEFQERNNVKINVMFFETLRPFHYFSDCENAFKCM